MMRFTALCLLALSASTSAYVVPNNKVVDNAVSARMPASGPVRTSSLVSALAERKVEARHHRGRGGKTADGAGGAEDLTRLFGRDAQDQEMTDAEDDAHWADLRTRSPHHRGKNKGGAGAGDN